MFIRTQNARKWYVGYRHTLILLPAVLVDAETICFSYIRDCHQLSLLTLCRSIMRHYLSAVTLQLTAAESALLCSHCLAPKNARHGNATQPQTLALNAHTNSPRVCTQVLPCASCSVSVYSAKKEVSRRRKQISGRQPNGTDSASLTFAASVTFPRFPGAGSAATVIIQTVRFIGYKQHRDVKDYFEIQVWSPTEFFPDCRQSAFRNNLSQQSTT